jgi:hypothetical protein
MIDPVIQAAGDLMATMSPEDRRLAENQLKLIVGAQASPESLVKAAPIQTLDEYLKWEIPVPPELASPYVVVRGGITATIGRSGKGKTVMNLNRLLRWAAGLPMFDGLSDALVPPQPLRILIIENEGAAGLFQAQIRIMLERGPFDGEQRKMIRENVMIWGDGGYSDLTLDKREDAEVVERGVEKAKPDIVFIEPFRGLWEGDENSSTEMTVVVRAMQRIATNYDVGMIVAHHEVKHRVVGEDAMNASRGSGVLENFVVAMENFESAKGGDERELSWSKMRYQDADRPSPVPVRMEWDRESKFYVYVAPEQGERAILQFLARMGDLGATAGDMAEELGEDVQRVRKHLHKLADEDLVKQRKNLSGPGFNYSLVQNEQENPSGSLRRLDL